VVLIASASEEVLFQVEGYDEVDRSHAKEEVDGFETQGTVECTWMERGNGRKKM
jgi:hypothetical protein